MMQDHRRPDTLEAAREPAEAKRRRIIGFLPNLLTLGAVLCGLTSIRWSGEEQYGLAIIAICGAVLLDVADGFAARLLSAQTAFGAELDSLADFLNFGVAPAMLLYQRHLHVLTLTGWAVAVGYVLATGLRLARFNVEAKNGARDDKWFTGLPSTGAAVAIIGIDAAASFQPESEIGAAIMALAALTVSVMMISRLRVPSLTVLLRRRGRTAD